VDQQLREMDRRTTPPASGESRRALANRLYKRLELIAALARSGLLEIAAAEGNQRKSEPSKRDVIQL
jgi:hypothetical protein